MRLRDFVKVVLVATCLGCSAARAEKPATTQPAVREYQLSENHDLDRQLANGVDVDLVFKLSPSNGTLFFGDLTEAGRPEDAAVRPLIAIKNGAKWKSLLLPEKSLANYEWVYAAAGPSDDEVWAVLDAVEEDPGQHLVLLHSVDGGKTWQSMTFAKPSAHAYFFDFAMSKDGQGRVSVSLDSSHRDADRAGLYHFKTNDGGKTWSGPIFESDAMQPADTVDEDDQPTVRPVAFHK